MIECKYLMKTFDRIKAADGISFQVKEGSVFGLIGTNGAGKSTVLRMMAGILKPDEGQILVDGIPVYEHIIPKEKIFFIADEPYFFSNGTAKDMEHYYSKIYRNFARENFYEYLHKFDLDPTRKVNTFSKGMKKQLALLLGICANTKYLLCDETFDGLDPVMRQGIKSIFAQEIDLRGFTPIIASHNLRELEDICDHLGLLHKGGVILSKDLEEMKCSIQKVQCVFQKENQSIDCMNGVSIIKHETRGSLNTFTLRGTREDIVEMFHSYETLFFEILPLSLEEIFISETEVVGYDIKKLILS